MIEVTAYRDKLVGVYGLSRTGMSVIRALMAGGAQIVCWDDDPGRRQAGSDLGARALAPDEDSWAGITALILSPGIPLTHPAPHLVVRLAERLGAEVIGDIELFARARPKAPVVAVTGTNGKSTTTSLIGQLLGALGRDCVAGGNLGLPALDFDDLAHDGVYVLELSSYQLDLIRSLRPAVSVLINLSPDHLDRHGGMDGYIAAKFRLFEMSGFEGRMVVGVDDDWSIEVADKLESKGARVTRVSARHELDEGIYAQDGRLYLAAAGERQCLADLTEIDTLRGQHNWQNAACAVAALEGLGYDPLLASEFLPNFTGLPHRMEMVEVIDGVKFVNDSKATNAEAAAQALAAFDDIHWIAGGIQKQGGIDSLAPYFPKIRHAFLIGEAADTFAATLENKVPITHSGDLASAVRAAGAMARDSGDAEPLVLLSPACASFDQFDSFEARGDAFRGIVRLLKMADQSKTLGGAA